MYGIGYSSEILSGIDRFNSRFQNSSFKQRMAPIMQLVFIGIE